MIKAIDSVVLTRSGQVTLVLALGACLASWGCGATTSTTPSGAGTRAGQLVISPPTINFGNVAVDSSQNQSGSLTAGTSNVTVSSAAWNGAGFSVSGITFPITVPAGQSIPFIVTFAPQTGGSSSGSISFVSNASNSQTTQTWTGDGVQPLQHTVGLSWSPSTSHVVGYNVYRGTLSGGPYTRLTSSPQPGTTFIDSTVQSGRTYYYVTTGVNTSLVESGYSNQAKATIPTP